MPPVASFASLRLLLGGWFVIPSEQGKAGDVPKGETLLISCLARVWGTRTMFQCYLRGHWGQKGNEDVALGLKI